MGTSLFLFLLPVETGRCLPIHADGRELLEPTQTKGEINFTLILFTEPLLKGVWHEIFVFRFCSWISLPQAPEYPVVAISNFYEYSRRYSQLFSDKLFTGVIDTGGKLSPESLLPMINYRQCLWLLPHFHQFRDTNNKFIAAINDTGDSDSR